MNDLTPSEVLSNKYGKESNPAEVLASKYANESAASRHSYRRDSYHTKRTGAYGSAGRNWKAIIWGWGLLIAAATGAVGGVIGATAFETCYGGFFSSCEVNGGAAAVLGISSAVSWFLLWLQVVFVWYVLESLRDLSSAVSRHERILKDLQASKNQESQE